MPPSPERSENVDAANQFHVPNSTSSTPVRSMTTYSPLATGGASTMALPLRPQYRPVSPTAVPPHLLQQLFFLARLSGSSSPRTTGLQSYAQPPSPFPPSGRTRGMPPPFLTPRLAAASTGADRGTGFSVQSHNGGSHCNARGSGAGRGPVAAVPGGHRNPRGSGAGHGAIVPVQGDAGGIHSNSRVIGAGHGRLAGARPLEITHINITNASQAEGNGDTAALQVQGAVLAMPTTGAAVLSRRLRPRAPKGSSTTPADPKKADRKKAIMVPGEPAGTHHGIQGSDHPKAVSPVAPPGKGRKRKSASTAAAPMPASTTPSRAASQCSLVAQKNNTSSMVAAGRAKKHTILTWLIDAGVLKEKEKVFYVLDPELAAAGNNRNGKAVTGTVSRAGIQCSCCDTAMPLPAFTSHAGAGSETLPAAAWKCLLLMSGKRLLRCVQEAWDKELEKIFRAEEKAKAALEQDSERNSQAKKRRKGSLALEAVSGDGSGGDQSDDACGMCADGGQLLCCDSCPSTFHPECLSVQVPEGSWVCHYCRCFLCLASDGGLSTCQQCACKYHQHCRPSLFAGHENGPYCSATCNKMAVKLAEMVGTTNAGGDGFSWSLLKIHNKDSMPGSSSDSNDDIAMLERNAKLAVALGVLDECFNPVKDRRTGIDMLHQAIYSLGSEFKRLSYEGFYTMVLEKDAEIISVALLRFHGSKLAEMPFAGTLPHFQRQGMMRRLVDAVQQVLETLQVENLLIPAVAEVVDTWKRSFGFAPVEQRLREDAKLLSMVVVTGTTLLQKPIVVSTSTAAGSPSSSSKQQHTTRGEEGEGHATLAVAPMSEDELAFLEMSWPVCSFTDLINGIAYSPRPFCADPSPAAVRGPVGGFSSCVGEAAGSSGIGCGSNMFQTPSYAAAACGGSLHLGVNK